MTNPVDIQNQLNALAFPCGPADGVIGPRTQEAARRFQLAWNLGPWLAVDGIAGPATQAALAQAIDSGRKLSPHFSVDELRSAGDGTCYVRRELLAALEQLRARYGRPLPIIDAYRDPAHNAAVGGAKDSMHQHGCAADLSTGLGLTVSWVQGLGLFSGIGDKNGLVAHVDVRHVLGAGNTTPGASPQAPARWHY